MKNIFKKIVPFLFFATVFIPVHQTHATASVIIDTQRSSAADTFVTIYGTVDPSMLPYMWGHNTGLMIRYGLKNDPIYLINKTIPFYTKNSGGHPEVIDFHTGAFNYTVEGLLSNKTYYFDVVTTADPTVSLLSSFVGLTTHTIGGYGNYYGGQYNNGNFGIPQNGGSNFNTAKFVTATQEKTKVTFDGTGFTGISDAGITITALDQSSVSNHTSVDKNGNFSIVENVSDGFLQINNIYTYRVYDFDGDQSITLAQGGFTFTGVGSNQSQNMIDPATVHIDLDASTVTHTSVTFKGEVMSTVTLAAMTATSSGLVVWIGTDPAFSSVSTDTNSAKLYPRNSLGYTVTIDDMGHFTVPFTGLRDKTTYYYDVVSTSGGGSLIGGAQSFSTEKEGSLSGSSSGGMNVKVDQDADGVTFNGTGFSTTLMNIEIDVTDNTQNGAPLQTVATIKSDGSFSASKLTGLVVGHSYGFEIKDRLDLTNTLISGTFVFTGKNSGSGYTGPTGKTGGLVPCRGPSECNFSALMELINNIINFLLFVISIPLAAILFAFVGFKLLFGGGSEESRKQVKSVALNVVLGLIFALVAWVVVHLILMVLGYDGSWIGL